jgi:hypothetical protein
MNNNFVVSTSTFLLTIFLFFDGIMLAIKKDRSPFPFVVGLSFRRIVMLAVALVGRFLKETGLQNDVIVNGSGRRIELDRIKTLEMIFDIYTIYPLAIAEITFGLVAVIVVLIPLIFGLAEISFRIF